MPDLKRIWIIGDGKPVIAFDAVLNEAHTSELVITENAIATGEPVNDHFYMLADRLEVQAAIGDIWIGMRDAQSPDAPIAPAKTDLAWLAGEGGGDVSTRSQRGFQSLRGLQRSAEPFQVQTGLRLYDNMVIRVLTTEQEGANHSALIFRATLAEVIRRSTETTTFPPRKPGKATRTASKKADHGEKQSQAVDDVNKAMSAAFSLLGDKAKGLTDTFKNLLPGGP